MVLVAEEEALIRMSASAVLRDAGFGVIEAATAEAALALLAHPEIETLFSDVELPGAREGLALARHIHEHRPDIGMLLTSGRTHPDSSELPDGGCFVAKPYDEGEVTRFCVESRPSSAVSEKCRL
jgi:DNA-binding NtrC family response regulator